MSTQWNVGDVVKLKSGGPSMTVWATNRDTTRCVWFPPGNTKAEYGDFPADTLRLPANQD